MIASEYCSGYKSTDGTWNDGFYCPQPESQTANFCCGSETFKFCCNSDIKDAFIQDYGGGGGGGDGDEGDARTLLFLESDEIPVIIGIIVCGIILLIVLITFISLYFFDYNSSSWQSWWWNRTCSCRGICSDSVDKHSRSCCCRKGACRERKRQHFPPTTATTTRSTSTFRAFFCPFFSLHQGVYNVEDASRFRSNGHAHPIAGSTSTAMPLPAQDEVLYDWQIPGGTLAQSGFMESEDTQPDMRHHNDLKTPNLHFTSAEISISSPLITTINGISSFLEDQIRDLPNPETDLDLHRVPSTMSASTGSRPETHVLEAMAMINSVPLPCFVHYHDPRRHNLEKEAAESPDDQFSTVAENRLDSLNSKLDMEMELRLSKAENFRPSPSSPSHCIDKPPVPPPRPPKPKSKPTQFATINSSSYRDRGAPVKPLPLPSTLLPQSQNTSIKYNTNSNTVSTPTPPYLRSHITSNCNTSSTRRRASTPMEIYAARPSPIPPQPSNSNSNHGYSFERGRIDLSPRLRISSTYPAATATLPLPVSPKFRHRTKTGNIT